MQVSADYVFQKYYTGRSSLKKEYKLPSLEEVEKYTRENHHLQEVTYEGDLHTDSVHIQSGAKILTDAPR